MAYEILDPTEIVQTINRLSARINERFPDSGLYAVSRRVHTLASEAKTRSDWIARPIWWPRVVAGLIIVATLVGTALIVKALRVNPDAVGLMEFIQVLEAGLNDLILIGAAIFFVVTLDTRLKRRRALAAIHEIRAVAHIVDMHQLTKDPERFRIKGHETPASPRSSLTRFELVRYLDYCSELLSLTSKVAALYVQHFEDSVALASANEVEVLCTGLSRKIWQKIMIVEQMP